MGAAFFGDCHPGASEAQRKVTVIQKNRVTPAKAGADDSHPSHRFARNGMTVTTPRAMGITGLDTRTTATPQARQSHTLASVRNSLHSRGRIPFRAFVRHPAYGE